MIAIFWSEKACNLDMKSLPALPGLSYMFVECENSSPNAMDFQICAWLGRMSVTNPDTDFTILSGDKGYAPLTPFMSYQFGVTAYLADPMQTASQTSPAPAELNPVRSVYESKLGDAGMTDPDDLRILSAILMQSMKLPQNRRKLDTRNRLCTKYGAQEGNLRYNAVKDIIKDIAEHGPYPDDLITPAAAPVVANSKKQLNIPTTNDVNKALSQGGVTLKTGQVAKAMAALLKAQTAKDINAARNIINTAMNQTFGASYRVKAYNAIIPFLRQIRDDA